MSMPLRRRVACTEFMVRPSSPVYPCNRSTYGRGNPSRATMQIVGFTRWDPLRDLLALHEQLGPLVGNDAPGWTPPVDLYETADAFILTAELPGLARDEIEIHAEEGRVVIRGARAGGQYSCEQYHRVERGHGQIGRASCRERV